MSLRSLQLEELIFPNNSQSEEINENKWPETEGEERNSIHQKESVLSCCCCCCKDTAKTLLSFAKRLPARL